MIPWLKVMHNQCFTQAILSCNWLVQARKGKGKEHVHGISYKRKCNAIAVIKTKPKGSGILPCHFLLTTANFLLFLTFFCCETKVFNGNKVKHSHVAVIFRLTQLLSFYLLFFQSPLKMNSFYWDNHLCACWNFQEVQEVLVEALSCHHPSPPSPAMLILQHWAVKHWWFHWKMLFTQTLPCFTFTQEAIKAWTNESAWIKEFSGEQL